MTNQGRLVPTGTSLRGKLDTTPKPRFLAMIEDYLYKELKALGVEDSTANESRLQVRIFFHQLIFRRILTKS